jgi:hypothetical protein
MEAFYSYQKRRSDFGRPCKFDDFDSTILESRDSHNDGKGYIIQNPCVAGLDTEEEKSTTTVCPPPPPSPPLPLPRPSTHLPTHQSNRLPHAHGDDVILIVPAKRPSFFVLALLRAPDSIHLRS